MSRVVRDFNFEALDAFIKDLDDQWKLDVDIEPSWWLEKLADVIKETIRSNTDKG